MAIYRLSLKVISRAAGRSACAAAAYRSGEPIYDERYGQRWDYSRRSDRVWATRLIGWAGTRAELWNAAEAAETRGNSRVAREIQLALPRELEADEQWALALTFASHLHTRYSVAVDVAHHDSHDGNPHAHMLFTVRRVENGVFQAKTRELDDRRTGPEEVEHMRAEWACFVNNALQEDGRDERVDHRSLKRQGIDRTPNHLPRAARAIEDRGLISVAGDRLRAALRADWVQKLLRDVRHARRRSADGLQQMIRRAVRSTAEALNPDRHRTATGRRSLAIIDQVEGDDGLTASPVESEHLTNGTDRTRSHPDGSADPIRKAVRPSGLKR